MGPGMYFGNWNGGGGIRTHEGFRPPVFKTGALNRSATPPTVLRPFCWPTRPGVGWSSGAPAAHPRSSRGSPRGPAPRDHPPARSARTHEGFRPPVFKTGAWSSGAPAAHPRSSRGNTSRPDPRKSHKAARPEPLCHPSNCPSSVLLAHPTRGGMELRCACGASSLVSRITSRARSARSPTSPARLEPTKARAHPLCHPMQGGQSKRSRSVPAPREERFG
jgi:hypothetical protein